MQENTIEPREDTYYDTSFVKICLVIAIVLAFGATIGFIYPGIGKIGTHVGCLCATLAIVALISGAVEGDPPSDEPGSMT